MAVIVPIAAEFDASGVKSAQASFAQFGQTLTKTLQQAGKDARKAFGDIEDGAKDSSTAAQRLALAITQSADKLDTELKQSKAAADALAKALGPEFVAKAGAGGINKLVVDLNRAGVSIQEITTEADVLAAAIQKVDDVNLQQVTAQTENLATGVQKVNTQVTASQQVLGSFAGQATTELANVGGSIGAVASGLGQVVAQGVAGRASLIELAQVAGPMAALSLVLLGIKQVFNDIKKSKAWTKEEVKNYTDALMDTASVSTVVRDRIDEVGGAFVQVQKSRQRFSPGWFFHLPASNEVKDITDKLVMLGLSSKEVAKIVAGGKTKVDEYTDSLKEAGISSSTTSLVSKYLNQQLEQTGDAAAAAAVKTKFGVGATDALASSMDTTAIAAGAAAVAIEQKTKADEAAAAAAEAAAQADRNQAAGIDAVREALYKRNNARYASVDADLSAKAAIEEYNKAQAKADKTGKAADIEKANALQREAEKALNNAAAAASNYASEIRSYATETERSNAATAAGADELNNLKNLLGKGSELVRTVEAWVLLLKQVPASIVTKFGISFGSSIAAPLPSVGTGMPGVSSSVIEGWQSTFNNSAGATSVTNITVNGATNSQETANLIATNQARSNQRQGTS